jgi:hypothetical protein
MALLAVQHDTPIEQGAIALLERIAGCRLIAQGVTSGREMTEEERELLRPGRRDNACRWQGLLRTPAGAQVAAVTAIFVPRRLPAPARSALGITASGSVPDERRRSFPPAPVLCGFGLRRQQLVTTLTPGYMDADGAAQVLCSVALLRADFPLAVVTERVYSEFFDGAPPATVDALQPAHA